MLVEKKHDENKCMKKWENMGLSCLDQQEMSLSRADHETINFVSAYRLEF